MNGKQVVLSKNKFYWIYLIGFFLILSLPLLVFPSCFTPTGWGKTIVFRIILSFLIFLFIYQIIFQKTTNNQFLTIVKNWLYKKSRVFWPFWLLIALLGIYFLATIFSLDPLFSLWGSPHRSGGFVNFAFYIIFAVITFLIVRQKDWQKIWDFALIIGILVAMIALFQQFGLISRIFIPYASRSSSTIGGPIFLAIYLLLLSFPCLSFGLKTKKIIGKLFYFLSFLFFIFVAVFITLTRAAMLGYLAGFLFFIFFYPIRKPSASNVTGPVKKFSFSLALKLIFLILLLFGIYGIYFINTQTELPQFVQENKLLKGVAVRLSIKAGLADPRVSSWKVSWEALKDRPILGYGPENFSIGFDKYYDPSLPIISEGGAEWWDRAHNFIFDISVTAGIPALIVYLSLFGTLFWQLQKVKRKRPETAIICHGIQAAFIGYLVANFFSFDTFSSYLISFLLIGYSLHLISTHNPNLRILSESTNKKPEITSDKLYKYRVPIIFVLCLILFWFIWSFNIKPFKINTQVNIAKYLVENGKCEQAFVRMDNVLTKKSFLDNYLRLKYVDFLRKCEAKMPGKNLEFAKKGNQLLKENIEIQPYYTRNWLFLGGFTNVLIEKEKNPEVQQELIKEAIYYFEKAYLLSPKREESLSQLINMYIRIKNYQGLAETYPRLISITSDKTKKAQLYASLAVVYKELGDKGKAREVALKALELHPAVKPVVDEFLRSLEQ